jgi:hypothetical protein
MSIELPHVPAITPPARSAGEDGPYFEHLARLEKVLDSETGEKRLEVPNQRDARRLSERLPEGYTPTTGADLTFDPRLAYEIALGIGKPAALFEKYGIEPERAADLVSTPAFITTIKKYQEEILAGGISFKLKAKMQAEDLLSHSYIIATDPEAPMAVRADLIKWTAKMADLEPKNDKSSGPSAGFTLNISFAGDKPAARVIEGEVTDV